jgi:WD40 repeat protein
MRKWFVVAACLSIVSTGCQRPSEERLRVVPQVSPVKPKRVVFSPADGNRLAVMEASGVQETSGFVGIWDVPSGREPRLFATIAAGVIDAAFSPDGKHVATVGIDGRVRWWGVDGRLEWVSQGGHGRPARAVDVSSELIASGGEDGTIRLWRHDGTPFGEALKAHDGPVMSVDISPRGEIASLGGDEVLRLWKRVPSDATSGTPPTFEPSVLYRPEERRYPQGFEHLLKLDTSWGWDRSVAFSPSGDVLAAVLFDGSVRLWNADGTPRASVENAHRGRPVRAVAFSPRGDLVASAGFDGTLRLWNLDGSPHGKAVEANYNNVFSVAFSPDGNRIATAGRDDRVRIWKLDGTMTVDISPGQRSTIVTVAVAPKSPVLAAADDTEQVRLWNLDGTPHGNAVESPSRVKALAFSADGAVLASGGNAPVVRLSTLDGAPRGKPLNVEAAVAALRFAPQGGQLAVGTAFLQGGASFQLWGEGHRLWQHPMQPADQIRSIAFSPRGDFIVTGSLLGELQVWNPDGSTRAHRAKQGIEMVPAIAVAPDGTYFVAGIGGSPTTVQEFNLDCSPRGSPFGGHRWSVPTLTFSPTAQLVTGADDGRIRMWTLPSREVEVLEVGLPIDQLGYWGKVVWVRAGGDRIFLYDSQRRPVATMLLRADGPLVYTPDGWYAGGASSSDSVLLYDAAGALVPEREALLRRSPERVLAAITDANRR